MHAFTYLHRMCVVFLIGEFAVNVQIRFSPVLQITFRAGRWIWKHHTSRRLWRWVCEPVWDVTFSFSLYLQHVSPSSREFSCNSSTIQKRSSLVWFESFAQAVKVTRKSQVASGEMDEDNERETEPWVFSF